MFSFRIKTLITLSIFLFACYSANGQVNTSTEQQKTFEPHMEALFASWEAVEDSLAAFCKGKTTCSTSYSRTSGQIPFRVQLINTSAVIKIDEASIAYGIKEFIHHGYSGYVGVEADEYEGLHRDTFVVAIEIADVKYSITPQFNQNWRGQLREGLCRQSSNMEVYPVEELDGGVVDSMWAMNDLNDFTMAVNFSIQMQEVIECYFEEKGWPTYIDYVEQSRQKKIEEIRNR